MQSILVRDMMIPIKDYAAVSEDATLYEAVKALKEAQIKFDLSPYHHRAVLVYDANGKIVGKLSQLDGLKSLEPKYEDVFNPEGMDRFGINQEYIRKMIRELGLLKPPLDDICRIAAAVKVKNIMHSPTEGEYISETASLSEAVLLLVVGSHQSLLVTRNKEIVGILRLSDVFKKISDLIESCKIV
ncbi:MAG: CBS domain-containing protein [Desulfobacterales bacterium]